MAGGVDVQQVEILVTANTAQATAAINQLKGATDGATKAIEKKAGATVNAGGAVISFGRIIQDAPFGIIGVANNITILSEQFVLLRAQAGGTTAAIQSMKAAMMGPLGLSIAISVITTALQFWALSNNKVDSSAKKAADRIKEMTEGAKIYNAVQKQGVVEGLTQIATLQKLATEYDNAATSAERKKKILETVNAIHPEVVKNLNTQKEKEQSLSVAIKTTTAEIYNKVEAQLIDSLLAPKYAELNKAFGDLQKVQEKYYSERSRLYGALGKGATPDMISQIMKGRGYMDELTNAELAFGAAFSGFTKFAEDVKSLARRAMGSFSSGITGAVGDYIAGSTGGSRKGSDGPNEKTFLQKFRDEIKLTVEIDNLLNQKTSQSKFKDFLKTIDDQIKVDGLTKADLLEWLKLRREVMTAMDEDYPNVDVGGEFSSLFKSVRGNYKKLYKAGLKNQKEEDRERLKQMKEDARRQYDTYKELFVDPLTNTFKGEFSKAWNDIFGEANSLLEKFLKNLGESLFNRTVGSIADSILGELIPGYNLITGIIGSPFDRKIVNNIIIDGERIASSENLVRGISANQDRMSSLGLL